MDLILARHAETVFNAAARMQGNRAHTPLTRAGIAQAEAMGAALRELLGEAPDIDLWVSPAGRTQQTAASGHRIRLRNIHAHFLLVYHHFNGQVFTQRHRLRLWLGGMRGDSEERHEDRNENTTNH